MVRDAYPFPKEKRLPKIQTLLKTVEYMTLPNKYGKCLMYCKDGKVKLCNMYSYTAVDYDGEYIEPSEFDVRKIAQANGIINESLFTIALAHFVMSKGHYDKFEFVHGNSQVQNQAMDLAQQLAYEVSERRMLSATGSQLQANYAVHPHLKKLDREAELAKTPSWVLMEQAYDIAHPSKATGGDINK